MADLVTNSRRFAVGVLVCAAVFTLAMMVYAAPPWDDRSSLGWSVVALGVWALSPYGVLALIAYRRTSSVARSVVVLVATCLIALLGIASLVYSFFVHVHSTSGLVFLSLPFLQWIGCAVTRVIVTRIRPPPKV